MFDYYHDTTPYSDQQFLMEHWMHCVKIVDRGINDRVVARCTREDEARLIVRLLNQHEKRSNDV